jgi:hypothetical protein
MQPPEAKELKPLIDHQGFATDGVKQMGAAGVGLQAYGAAGFERVAFTKHRSDFNAGDFGKNLGVCTGGFNYHHFGSQAIRALCNM